MNKAKKVLAFVLAVVMCVSLFTTFAFAAGGTGEIPADIDRPKTAYNIVCIGDEYANGRGLPGYGTSEQNIKNYSLDVEDVLISDDIGALDVCADNSYVRLLGNRIQYALGQGFDVSTTSLCFNGMRAEDFQAVLEKAQGDHYSQVVVPMYEGWFKQNMDQLNDANNKMDPEEWDKLSPLQKVTAAGLEPYADLQDYFVDKIRNASLITYDLGMNNFGTYLLNRLETAIAWASTESHVDAAGNPISHVDDKGEPYYGPDYPYYGDDPEAVHGDLVLGSEDMLRLLVNNTLDTFAGVAPESLIKELSNAFLYAFFDYCVSFQKDIAYIRFLAPLSQIIVVGSYNAIDNFKFSIPYPEGEMGKTLDVNLGAFWKTYLGYAESFVVNGQVGTQYKYAETLTVDVETLFDEAVNKGLSGQYEQIILKEMLEAAEATGVLPMTAAEALVLLGSEKALKGEYEWVVANKPNSRIMKAMNALAVDEPDASNLRKAAVAKASEEGATSEQIANCEKVYNYFVCLAIKDMLLPMMANVDSSLVAQTDNRDSENVVKYSPYIVSVDAISGLAKLSDAFKVALPKNQKESFPAFQALSLYTRMLAGTDSLGLFVAGAEENPVPVDSIVTAPIGTLPSEAGHQTKLNAILKTWILPGNADTKGEDVTIGTFESFFDGLTSSFQVPILDTINEAFRNFLRWIPDFFGNFFQSIKDGFNGLFKK